MVDSIDIKNSISNPKYPLTICMPLYNEGKHLREALTSILAQSEGDFQIIASDNCSQDDTLDILQEFAAVDDRISVITCIENIGAIANWQMLQNLVKSEFVMFAAGHDRYEPEFIKACMFPFRNDPYINQINQKLTLSYPAAYFFDDHGTVNPSEFYGLLDTRGLALIQRVLTVAFFLKNCYQMYGIIRQDALRATEFRPIIGPDNLQLIEMAFRGSFAYVPKHLFHWRVNHHPDSHLSYRSKLFVKEQGTEQELALRRMKDVVAAYIKLLDKYSTQSYLDELARGTLLMAALYKVRLIASYYQVKEEELLANSENYRRLYSRIHELNQFAQFFCQN